MSDSPALDPRAIADLEHLKLLSIFHYILGGTTVLFSCLGLIHFCFGLFMLLFPESFHGPKGQPAPPPPFFGYLMLTLGGGFVLVGWTVGALTIYSGLCIQRRRRRTLSLVVSGLNCINCAVFPFAAVLAVFTIVVLMRDSVVRLYDLGPGG